MKPLTESLALGADVTELEGSGESIGLLISVWQYKALRSQGVDGGGSLCLCRGSCKERSTYHFIKQKPSKAIKM